MNNRVRSKYIAINHDDRKTKLIDKYANTRQDERGLTTSGPKALAPNYKAVTGGSAYRNGILSRIVEEMKSNFLDGEIHAISLDEILELTSQTEISFSLRNWLITEALPNSPFIKVVNDNLYVYKPPLDCWSKQTLEQLFQQKDADGPMGILEDNILASVPHAQRVLQELEDGGKIFSDLRSDKKKVYFYKSPTSTNEMPDAYKKLWKSVFIYGMDDTKIEQELFRNNIQSSNTAHIIRKVQPKRKSSRIPGSGVQIRDNAHVKDLLISYDTL